jgi:glycosyltransferase involved in cell wall biosynthesis
MKIVQLVTQMEAAGAQKVAYLLHQGFGSRGHDSELWFLYTKRPAYVDLPGVMSLLPRCATRWDYLPILARLCAYLRRSEPDVLITHTHYANVMGQAAAFVAGVRKRIAVQHNPLPTYPRDARFADRILGYLGAYSAIVGVSDAVTETIRYGSRRHPRLVRRIYNGVPPIGPEPLPDIRNKWNIPESRPVLLSVARLARQKNHATLLRALCELPEAQLILAGDGEFDTELRRQVSALSLGDRVLFTGEITQLEVRALMHCADVFVFPSLWEAMPMAAVEAMSAGMPIVASDIAAHREVLGPAALLVPATDSSALAQAVRRLLSDAALAQRLRIAAVERAQRFSVEAMVQRYERLICLPFLEKESQSRGSRREIFEEPEALVCCTAPSAK